jgi:Protein of unknown function (DUF760)/EF-hand domain pair
MQGTLLRHYSVLLGACALLSARLLHGFSFLRPRVARTRPRINTGIGHVQNSWSRLHLSNPAIIVINLDDDDDERREETEDEEDEEDESQLIEDPYTTLAASEFMSSNVTANANATDLVRMGDLSSTSIDWGGALGKLRQRVDDIAQGKSGNPSQALFRLMSNQSPNQVIGSFVNSASPQVVQAMSGAVSSLLGGLSSPTSGVETIVKATGEKLGSLCFQLQMTGYMFRNVEYVMALKDLMKLRGSATLQDYKDAFDRLDGDNNGYIEAKEVADLLNAVYDGNTPEFEIDAFIRYFDENKDGRVSWEEFERGLGASLAAQAPKSPPASSFVLGPSDEEEDDEIQLNEPEVSGTVQIELKNGQVVEVDAKEYIQNLKDEAQALKDAILRESSGSRVDSSAGAADFLSRPDPRTAIDEFGGIANYIASRQGDVKALTQGISPEIVETMRMLIDFVLEGGDSGKGKNVPKEKLEMEIPGSALQQLALWQLILGYRLREAEAKGDYLKLLK